MVIDDLTMSSNIFLQMEVIEMGWWFAATPLLPPVFYIGQTWAFHQAAGISLMWRDLLTCKVSAGVISPAAVWSRQAGLLSGVVALHGLSF